jgi:hypothetical protein
VSALEGLDDDHAAAAAGARPCRRRWFVGLVILIGIGTGDGHGEELASSGNIADTAAVGE